MINTNLPIAGSSPSNSISKGLSSDEFLGLMIEEIKNQDPLNPSSSADQLQRLSDITSVQNLTEIRDLRNSESYTRSLAAAAGMIGRNVVVDGEESYGRVRSVSVSGSQIVFNFENGKTLPLSQGQYMTVND